MSATGLFQQALRKMTRAELIEELSMGQLAHICGWIATWRTS